MKVKVFPANQATAINRATVEGKIRTIAQAGDQIMLEYISDRDTLETIVFKKQDDDLFVWHECAAQKSNYARGCWHMGLIAWVYTLPEQAYELELLPPLGNMVAEVDLTSGYLNRPGEFNIIKLDPQKVKESRAVETMSEEEIESLPEEDRFLAKYRLPKPLLEKLLSFRNKQKVRLTDEQKSRIPLGVNYIPQNNEVVYATAALLYDTWAPPLFMGPAGSGKSSLAELMAEILYLPFRRISGGIDVNAEYLLGAKTLAPTQEINSALAAKISLSAAKAGTPLTSEEFSIIREKLQSSTMQVVHEPGVLLQAVTDGEMVLIDEVNMLIPEVTSLLHSLLDWQRSITVSGVGEVKAHPDFRLVSAMNVGYMGTRPLNKAFRDRFRGIQVPGITENTLLDLLAQWVDNDTANKLSKVYKTLYDSVYSPVGATLTESCLSLRALLRAAEEYSIGIGTLKSIVVSCLTESIESDQEREQVKDLIEMNLS